MCEIVLVEVLSRLTMRCVVEVLCCEVTPASNRALAVNATKLCHTLADTFCNNNSSLRALCCPFGNLDFHQFCSRYLEHFYFYICHDKIWCNLKNNRQNLIMFSVVQS